MSMNLLSFPQQFSLKFVMGKRLKFLTFLILLATVARADDTNAPATSSPSPAGKVLAPSNDVGLGSDGTIKDADSYQVRIGELYAPGGEAYIIPIRLPALPDGQQFKTVHLRAQLIGIANDANVSPLANADLYGLGVRDNSKAIPADYYQGPHPDPKATLIQANFLTPTSKVRTDQNTGPFVETSSDADVALAKFLNDAYAKGAKAGQYVILRISYDADPIPSGNNGYQLLTTGATGDEEPPIFTYTVEPVSK